LGFRRLFKKDYSPTFFRKIDPFKQFCWKWVACVGRTGGILRGFRYSKFDVCDTVINRFFIKVTLMDLKIQKKWCLPIVYGAAQEDDKENFLTELGNICRDRRLPLLVGVILIY
jgi:hypothetical protein